MPPSRSRHSILIACRLLWLAAAATASAQVIGGGAGLSNQPASQKKVRLVGIVVNAETGEGVSKAKVDIFAGEQISVFSGPDGHFEVENVPAGQWQVSARKPGYFSDQELSRNAFRPKLFAVSESSTEITVRLTPAASITGHVLDDKGEPVEFAQVNVIVSAIDNGRRAFQQPGGGSTDDSGEYSISGLMPGGYYVRVNNVADGGTRLAGRDYDEVYAGSYYPGAPTQDQAAILHVSGGQQVQADFTMARVRAYRVSGRVATQGGYADVTAFLNGEDSGVSAGVQRDGRFQLTGLVPGQYSIVAMQPTKNQPLFGEELVAVGQADVKNVQILFQPPQSIPVHIQVVTTKEGQAGNSNVRQFVGTQNFGPASGEGPQPNNQPRFPINNIALQPARSSPAYRGFAQLNPNGLGPDEALALSVSHPGTYRVDTQPFPPYYIESMRSGSSDLLDQPLTVTSGGAVAPIQIVLRDDSASLTVKVMENGQPASGGAVLIVPAAHPSESVQPRFWMGGTGMSVGGLAPGDYRVYAFDSIDNLEYANPEALREFSAQSQTVTLGANGSATVTLELIALTQPRSTP